MIKTRIIPVLLLQNNGLVKTVKFKNSVYLGDPINTVKIFNQKEVDEIIFLNIESSKSNKAIDFNQIEEIAGETFMPFAYGGGITSIDQVRTILKSGAEKIVVNTKATQSLEFIKQISNEFGSQSVVVAIDFAKNILGRHEVYSNGGTIKTKHNLIDYVQKVEESGAGEIFLNSINHDGMMNGYDYDTINIVSKNISIPLIACGGAGSISDFEKAIQYGANAVAAGSYFVFYGKHKGVLITYPTNTEIQQLNFQ